MKEIYKNRVKGLIFFVMLLLVGLATVGKAQALGLTDTEKYWLSYMREEEKLARDVYLFLNDKWNLPIFANISESEQRHMDAVKTLLSRYGLPDPAAGKGPGEFSNQDFQELYNKLTLQGSGSLVEALKAGAFIEETDISDLNEGIATTRHKDIKNVYSNLLQGSLNHLKAFVSTLASYGVVFEP
jgi:hypothetical protein